MKKLEKLRLSVPMSSDLYEKVETSANKLGISKSSYVSFIVAQFITNQEIVYSQLGNALNNLPADFLKQIQDFKAKEESKE